MRPTLCRSHRIPIYYLMMEVVVCESIKAAHNEKKRRRVLGKYDKKESPLGLLCMNSNGDITLFLSYDGVSRDTIAHEVFHATCFMLEYTGVRIDKNNHEAAAYLNGYITHVVYKDLDSWGLTVK